MNGKQIIALLTASFGAGTFAQAGIPELQQKLDELKNKPEPRDLNPGAMCYARVIVSTSPEHKYICPVCGNHTVYPEADAAKQTPARYKELTGIYGQLQQLQLYTKLLNKIVPQATPHGYILSLDTTPFCATCGKDKPKKIMLAVRKPDDTTTPAQSIDEDDLLILDAFFAGKDRWKGDQDIEHPLKQSLPRIRELLNLPETPQP